MLGLALAAAGGIGGPRGRSLSRGRIQVPKSPAILWGSYGPQGTRHLLFVFRKLGSEVQECDVKFSTTVRISQSPPTTGLEKNVDFIIRVVTEYIPLPDPKYIYIYMQNIYHFPGPHPLAHTCVFRAFPGLG